MRAGPQSATAEVRLNVNHSDSRLVAAALAGAMALLLAACGGSAANTVASNASGAQAATVDVSTLKGAAANRGVLYGIASGQQALESDADFASQVAAQAGILVPENELKWETTEAEPGKFNFAAGDALLAFASAHQMQFRGHTLVWHRQIPAWAGAGDADNVRAQLVSHITAEVSHYAGRVHSWDVVNEAVEPLDGRADGLRNSVWMQALGPQYIELAFRTAAQADPHALLVYNDYGVEYDTPEGDRRRAAVLQLLTELKNDGTPIDALGIQAHLVAAASGQFNASKFSAFVRSVAALGLQVFITELDVNEAGIAGDVATRDAKIADAYQKFLSAALREPAVKVVITWGLSDRYTWLSSWAPRLDGAPVRPLPLAADLSQKPAWSAMMGAFAGAAER